MRVNRDIRARELRIISSSGEQLGVMPFLQALALAEEQGFDLVEIVPTSSPPVAKIMNYGKFLYDQTKREKENKKSQHQVKIKEIKLNLNINEHDLEVKLRHAKEFLEKGNKVKISIIFRGRELAHPELGTRLIEKVMAALQEIVIIESEPKLFGRMLNLVLSPAVKKKKQA